MKDIVIDGVNLNDLKKRFDEVNAEMASMRQSIRKGASKFIADNIEGAKKVMDGMLESEDADEVDTLAKHAHELLSTARFVSEVSGVSFDLPYYDRQSEYHPYGEPYSNQIEYSDNNLLSDSKVVDELYGLLESMESDVSDWNTSYC